MEMQHSYYTDVITLQHGTQMMIINKILKIVPRYLSISFNNSTIKTIERNTQ